jgi:hypothetical protein
MIKVLGEHYFLDLDAIDEFIQIPNSSGIAENHISVVKYDTVKLLLEVIMSDQNEVDEMLGSKGSQVPISFKLAFNTLLSKQLLKSY